MKKAIYPMVVLILAGCLKANAQVADTLVYLKSVEANKSQFIGQPFSVLKNSLLVKPAVFYPLADKAFNMYAETSTLFYVQNPVTATDYATRPTIRIYWNADLNKRISDSIWQANNGGYWSLRIDSLYGPKIIKNIVVSGEE